MTPFKHDTVTPYKTEETKKNQVKNMFDGIASRYDFLNHFLSLGTDILWRKIALGKIKTYRNKLILDVATGTGDLAIEAAAMFKPEHLVAVDIAEKMLEIGREKIKKSGLEGVISFQEGDSEHLSFDANHFDTVMSSFGVRNFENLELGLSEMYRVLKPGGVLMVLEFSKPRVFPIKQLYNFYFKNILPFIGKMISRDSKAYGYLYESSSSFPCFEEFTALLEKIGFHNSRYYALSFGICSIYIAEK
ncbi:MAG: bifunctional demethylmenaquinone methyltransferase/2-methoxy-6-polyprenyl-1,4-benzoquinol methylase UbiE [Saprospiraceae bacterium]|nr:bifunctional demethylmenaquinone methyltransferase/2-methoxy-6-polyprenyl-1,4-benzoquinol methylase UbiE [Saprospiraceae bacterium]